MLTDMIVEEEFELKEDEPWLDKQDLEHDLQLAAELGKTLLDRNRELEQGLQQMYSTNQEQLQEIEYLTKQVDLLRQVNDQHAKVYEQLDASARDLEQSNHKLCLDNRKAQQKINGLTETVELLQTQVEELQQQVEEVKLSPSQLRKAQSRQRFPQQSSQSVSCLKELQNSMSPGLARDVTIVLSLIPKLKPWLEGAKEKIPPPALAIPEFSDSCDPSDDLESFDVSWREEEQASLRQSLRSLQTQFAGERARRAEAEREAELLASQNAAMEQQLAGMETFQIRVSELEREAEELRHLWKSDSTRRSARRDFLHGLLSDSVFLGAEEETDGEAAAKSPLSAEQLKAAQLPGGIYDHECSCVRRAEVVKYRGISLLNEVDAQYSALQVKYDELLRRCHATTQEEQDELSHKAVQTACPALSHLVDFEDDFHQPEYKELFREIFSRIRKTKEDLQNRGRPSAVEALPI